VNGGTKLQEVPEIKNYRKGLLTKQQRFLFLLSQRRLVYKTFTALRPACGRQALRESFIYSRKEEKSQREPLLCDLSDFARTIILKKINVLRKDLRGFGNPKGDQRPSGF